MTADAPVRFFVVGGKVRDEIMGIRSKDIDFSVEAPSFEAMEEAVEARCSKVFRDDDGNHIGGDFFTIRGLDPEFGAVDFVWAREDGPSSDGRHPDWVKPGDIFADLRRRDFTANAIAIDADTGERIDPHGGEADIAARRLRFVGVAEDRLREDALRAFRGLRFQITKGLILTPDAVEAIQAMTPEQFDAVSTNRIRDEMFKCFTPTNTRLALRTFRAFPVLFDLALDRGLWLKATLESR